MIKSLKILAAIFLLIIISILLLQIDDEINPEAQAMMDDATQYQQSDAYEYFWGIQAAIDEDHSKSGS